MRDLPSGPRFSVRNIVCDMNTTLSQGRSRIYTVLGLLEYCVSHEHNRESAITGVDSTAWNLSCASTLPTQADDTGFTIIQSTTVLARGLAP